MMNPLRVSPLPALRADPESDRLPMEREGFVDEAVVTALVNGGSYSRSAVYPDDLALAADDSDFAGWRLSKAVTMRSAEGPPQMIEAVVRRAAPPVVAEPGPAHQASHRDWLARLAGAISTLLFSVLAFTSSPRPGWPFETPLSPEMLTAAKPVALQMDEPAKLASELNEVSPVGR